jgi:hypothetical protein
MAVSKTRIRHNKKEIEEVKEIKAPPLPPVDEITTPSTAQNLKYADDFFEVYYYNKAEITFLTTYAKTLDIETARVEAKLSPSAYNHMTGKPKIVDAMCKIADNWFQGVQMEAKTMAGMCVRVANKMEKKLDEGDTKVASALSSIMKTLMQATGHFDKATDTKTGSVVFNVNITNGTEKQSMKITPINHVP